MRAEATGQPTARPSALFLHGSGSPGVAAWPGQLALADDRQLLFAVRVGSDGSQRRLPPSAEVERIDAAACNALLRGLWDRAEAATRHDGGHAPGRR